MNIVLPPARLSESGRPLLGPGEIERALLDKVDLQFSGLGGPEGQPLTDKLKDGSLRLTSHRILWVDATAAPLAGASCAVPLAAVHNATISAKVFRDPKLKVYVHLNTQQRPVPAETGSERVELLQVVCKGANPQQLLESLQQALKKRAWEVAGPSTTATSVRTTTEPAPAPSPLPQPRANPELLEQLCNMGFPRLRSTKALLTTNNAGLQEAIEWIFAHEHESDIDQPLPPPPLERGLALASNPAGPAPPARTTPAAVGVAGILRREEQQMAASGQTLESAFRDLSALMDTAQDLVQLAERFRSSLARGEAGALEGGEAGEYMDRDMEAELIRMGIASPVTKDTAGVLYHQELARELADFLRPQVERAGGMLAMPDIFCLFNRARGSELVSPDDLLHAAQLFPSIRASLQLRQFSSGVLVVQASSHNDQQVNRRIADMVGSEGLGPPVTATDVATLMSIPLAIAAEHLLTAENAGILCRDDGPEGIRFFRNFFCDNFRDQQLL